MKIQWVDSIYKYIPGLGESQEIAEDHRGKAARIKTETGRSILLILPCGHIANLDTWNVTDIDTDEPSATPSIFCRGKGPGLQDCWHGYLTKGELIA